MVVQQQPDGRVVVGFTGDAMATKTVIESVARIVYQIPIADVQDLIDEYQRAETLTPIFDPTAFLRVQKTMPGHVRLAEAFLAFRQALDTLIQQDGR